MKLQTLAAACAAVTTLAIGSAAFAGEAVTAKLSAPVAQKVKFIAGGAVFVCEADACVANATTNQTFASATCKTIAGKLGPLAAFGDHRKFDAQRLADCNATAIAKAGDATKLAKQ
jgi:hypothetical protein